MTSATRRGFDSGRGSGQGLFVELAVGAHHGMQAEATLHVGAASLAHGSGAGRIVEHGPSGRVIGAPAHPYTEGLLNSIPSRTTPGQRLNQIPGMAPSVLHLPPGCPFSPRCRYAEPACETPPPIASCAVGSAVLIAVYAR